MLVAIDDDPVRTIFSLLNSQAKQFALDRFVGFGATAVPMLLEGYDDNTRGQAELVVEIRKTRRPRLSHTNRPTAAASRAISSQTAYLSNPE